MFSDLTEQEQRKRRLLSEEGIVCWECGCSLIGLASYYDGMCDDCLREEIKEAEASGDWEEDDDDSERECA